MQLDKRDKCNYAFNKLPEIVRQILKSLEDLKDPANLILNDKSHSRFDEIIDSLSRVIIKRCLSRFKI